MNGVSAAGFAASSSKLQANEAIEAAHAKIVKMLPEGIIQGSGSISTNLRKMSTKVMGIQQERSIWKQFIDPELPPLLAPIPGFCRLIAILIIAPIIVACLTDFAGYAIFRTLGFRRRRVRVKESQPSTPPQQTQTQQSSSSPSISDPNALTAFNLAAVASNGRQKGSESPSMIKAPLLSPGAYDADALLRHRARSISGESAEAEEEWNRTGGSFARVSSVRASQEAAAAASSSSSKKRHVGSIFGARVHHVGVEGALGYSDTDADDSGAESGRSSPEMGRKPWRRGLSKGLGFTPVSPKENIENEQDFFGKLPNRPMYDDNSPLPQSPILSSEPSDMAASRAADLEPADSIVTSTTALTNQTLQT